jgi:hypothetical protein
MEQFEENIKKSKANNFEYVAQMNQWKKDKEKEHQQILLDREATIKKNKEVMGKMAEKVKEMKLWKDSQNSSIQTVLETR